MHLHLNPLGGLAGDMFCAALLDAHPELLTKVQRAVASVTGAVRIRLLPAEGPIGGKRFHVEPSQTASTPRHHTQFRRIRSLLDGSDLSPGIRGRALAVFELLAEAEARVHGTAPDDVEFHEIGAWDSIADIVGAAALQDALGVVSASCAPLPLGSGQADTAHGPVPVPAPATALLLRGLAVRDDAIDGERVTPTGAAILQALKPRETVPDGLRLSATGRGFGTRRLPGIPNCLQILCLNRAATDRQYRRDRVAELRFEVDDQTPEDLALGLDRLRGLEGVLSVTTHQAFGKKGRLTMRVEVLARPEALHSVVENSFCETATIGLRHSEVDRYILSRAQREVEVGGRRVSVKVVERPRGRTAKAESEDLVDVAGRRERDALRRGAAARALGWGADSKSEHEDE